MKRLAFECSGVDRPGFGRYRCRRPTFPMDRALPTPSISRSTPIAGPAPISVAISAMPGARSTTIRPSRRASRAASRPATIGSPVRGCSASKATSKLTGAEDTFAPWKFSNPWFGTRARPRRLCLQQHPVLWYRRPGVRRIARRDIRPVGIPYHRGLDRGVGAEFGLAQNWSAKIEYLYVDLADSHFTITGMSNGYRFGLVRAGVNYHF